MIQGVKELIENENLSIEESLLVELAAWFHDTGYIEGCKNHEERSAEIAKDFMATEGFSIEQQLKVASIILATEAQSEPKTVLEKILRDADYKHFTSEHYLSICESLRAELQYTVGKTYTDLEWAYENQRILLYGHRFFTEYAKKNWQPLKELTIAQVQKRITKLTEGDITKTDLKKKKLEKMERPERGIETMFRVTLNNHTRLSEIADSKANILLSVNAIIISIALSTLIPKLDAPSNAHLIMPTLVMLLFSVASIIFAIMSTRPKVTRGVFTPEDVAQKKVNLLFFGNFYKMPIESYLKAVNEVMKDRDYLYDSMIKDLYYLGLVLNRKYKLLRITYTVFMIGIIVSVATFVWAFRSAGF